MNLDIRQLIDGPPSRLRYVYRFSTSRVQHRESVAEHSYYVGLYCLLIGTWFRERPNYIHGSLSIDFLLTKALLHDLEEAKSGDFPRLFKHSSPELKAMLERASSLAFLQVIEPVCGPSTRVMTKEDACSIVEAFASNEIEEDGSTTDAMVDTWINAKEETFEGMILEFSDFLSVLSFFLQEMRSGNRSIGDHVEDMVGYFHMFETDRFNFLSPLIDQTAVIMKEVFGYERPSKQQTA